MANMTSQNPRLQNILTRRDLKGLEEFLCESKNTSWTPNRYIYKHSNVLSDDGRFYVDEHLPLHLCISTYQWSEGALALMRAGADINAATTLYKSQYKRQVSQSALMLAAEIGDAEMVEELLLNGADVNKTYNQHDGTALLYAVQNRHERCVKYLVENGADVNVDSQDNNGCFSTPLLMIIKYISYERYFDGSDLQLGRNGQLKTSDLFKIRKEKELRIFLLLMNAGANPNEPENAVTPLMKACEILNEYGIKVVKTLLNSGADVNYSMNVSNHTASPLTIAAGNPYSDILLSLIQHGANIFIAGPFCYREKSKTSQEHAWICGEKTLVDLSERYYRNASYLVLAGCMLSVSCREKIHVDYHKGAHKKPMSPTENKNDGNDAMGRTNHVSDHTHALAWLYEYSVHPRTLQDICRHAMQRFKFDNVKLIDILPITKQMPSFVPEVGSFRGL